MQFNNIFATERFIGITPSKVVFFMAEWTIYGKDGVAKASVKELELHDEWMAECFITVSVKSAETIDFAVGDYIDYRNERYSINYDPSKIKRARRGTYGEGFVYDNIKFVAVQDELVRCDFCDLVLSDNNIHYTQLSTFPFYCETVDDLLDRIQANMEDLYPGSWIIISPDLNRDRQRGLCVDREQAFIDAYNKYIGEGSEFTYEKTGVALTVDNINCWDALAKVNTDFALNFIVRDRIVIVGTAGVFTPKKFRYGKGNGLYELEAIGDSEQKVVTRLRAYGSEQNLPDRYYAERNLRVFSTVTEIESKYGTDSYTGIAFFTDLRFSAKYFTYRSQSYPGTSDRPNYIVRMSAHGHEVTGFVSTDYSSDNFYIYSEYKGDIPDDRDEENREEMEAFTRDLEVGDKVYFTAYVEKGAFDAEHQESSETSLPDNMAVNKLMLPGFPDMSLDEWVRANRPELIEEGFEFSTNPVRPYIDSPNKERYGIRPSNIFFDGTGDTDDIHPTLEGMTWDGHACDVVVEAQQIEDNGVLSDSAKETDKRVTITIPYAGFKLNEEWVDGATISMKDGMCGARDFKILKKPTQNNDGNWICICERAYDSVLKMYFPYSDFQIHTGDKFVLTGIDLPDSYIEAASVKLFDAAMDALRKNHLSRVTYQPKIDHIWMAHQHDTAMASGGAIESLHDTLKAGDYFSFADEDLNIDASIIIDILTIKEHADSGLATYEITLRDEKVVSALEKRLEKIVSDASGNGGSYSMRQTGSLVEQIGNELYLSKIEDDDAAGSIGFMKSAWFGIKDWFIDNTGSANLFNATINGLLTAYNAVINTVKSSNYSGDGMLDTGWRITNDYQGGNSKATFDFLYIRKKAFFEELEIRKLSHIGGNFCLSGASGRVWRVEYFDKDGKRLGYDVKIVPWTFKGMVLMLFAKNKLNKYWGREKLIERKLTDEERAKVRTIRVYMFTDDGSTETMLNWTVGAQARCQSFNITKQMEFDGSSWKGLKVGNTYWYRLVTATGDKVMDDGNTHQYVEFSVDQTKEGTAYEWADAGSDFPSVGDAFVQMGHRTREDQSNVIMLETANEDSPAIKMYAGVNWWTVRENQLVATMSPKGWKVSAESFEWLTRYGERFHQTINRGVWVLIPLDEDGERKCYFNDMVSHNGCYWRCIVAQGSYTTDEPSESSSAWSKEVYAGIAPYLTLSDQMLGIPCEKDGKATASYGKAITVKLMVTNLEATITNLTLTGGDSHVEKTANNKIAVTYSSGSAVTNKDYTITVEGDLNGNHYVATDKISVYAVIRGNDAYEVTCTPEVFIWSQQETEPYAINIDKTSTGNSSLGVSVKNDGVDQPFQITSVTVVGKNASGTATSVSAQYDNNTKRVWVKSIANDTLTGQLTINVKYGNNAVQTIIVPFYCNLIGTWQEKVVGDTKTEVAQRMKFDICDETGKVIGTTTLANYVKSSSGSTASLQKQTAALSVEDERLKTELGTTKRSLEKSIDDTETELSAAITAGDSALSTSIANAKTELKGDVNTVSTSLATYEQTNDRAVQALGTRVSNTETSITNTNTRVSTAEGSIQTISSTVTTQGNSISGLNKRMGAAETSITNTNTRVSTAESNINTVKHDLYDSTGLLKSNYSTTTQTATMIQNEVASKTKGMVTTSTFKQTADSFSLCTTSQASGYANTAESNAKSAAQGYANTAENNAESYANGVGSAIETKLSETGIIINGNNRRIDLIGGKVRVLNSSKQAVGKVEITSEGKIKAVDGDFSGKITATSGNIGGFSIGTQVLSNSNWNAGVDISYDSKTVKIGKNAAGSVNTEQAIIRAENTKSWQTYNTALYLNAQNATYNYAFYGNGNGVLNGLMFGYKVQFIEIPSGSNHVTKDIILRDGSTIILTGTHSSGHVKVMLPTLSEVKSSLGIPSNSKTEFAIEINILNRTNYGDITINYSSTTSANSTYPIFTDHDNVMHSGWDPQLAVGDYMKILLVYAKYNNAYYYNGFQIIRNA